MRAGLAGQHVPALQGPSGDVKEDEADPTYLVGATRRGVWPVTGGIGSG